VVKSERDQRMTIVASRTRGAQQARLSYRTLGQEKAGTLLEVQLHTGRKHQIRLQLASIGCPIVGDRKYGGRKAFLAEAIGLACVRLAIEHPTTQERLEFKAPVPVAWKISFSP
jgi:23S rRNA pseudouridine1911/1915/1917 synthase